MKSLAIFFVLQWLAGQEVEGQRQRCVDRNRNCYWWSLMNYCHEPRHARAMAIQCRKSCHLCSTGRRVPSIRRFIALTVCRDVDSSCDYYRAAGYCSRYPSWMEQNCRASCGKCPTQAPPSTTCQDLNSYCSSWKQYCDQNSAYWAYMSKNCRKTCNLCTDGGGGGGGSGGSGGSTGKKEYVCGFETDFCDWANQPIDDAVDWAVGVASGGPSSGANNSASYAYVDSTSNSYNAKLILPWELVLPLDKLYIGSMCLHISYQTGSGSLKVIENVYPTANNKSPSQLVKATLQGSGTWVDGKVLVQVDDKRQLALEGIVGRSGRVAIDNISFVKGNC